MSKRNEAVNEILKLLSDGALHSSSEIKEVLFEKGIADGKNISSFRNAIYWLKQNNDNFISPTKGIYKLKDIVEENDMFEQEILYLNQELNELEKVDWRTATNEELDLARIKLVKLRKLSKRISQVCGGNE